MGWRFYIFLIALLSPLLAFSGSGRAKSLASVSSSKAPSSTPQPASVPVHGISIRGSLKYPANFTHFAPFNPKAPKGGKIQVAVVGTFNSLNPFVPGAMCAKGLGPYSYLTFDTLLWHSPDEPFALYARLAEGVILSPQRDRITFFLNPRARFQNGEPVRARDVIFTFDALKAHGTPVRKMLSKKVKEIREDSPLQLTFVFHPAEDGVYDHELPLIIACMPVLSEKALSGQNFPKTGLTPLMGSGPYRIQQVEAGRMIVFERDPLYWGRNLPSVQGLYNFDKIVYEYFSSDMAAFEAFKKRDVTYRTETSTGRWAHEYTFPAVTEGHVRQEILPFSNAAVVHTLLFNTHRSPFKDPLVRRAVGSLFDFEWINAKLFDKILRRTSSFFGTTVFAAHGKPSPEEEALLKQLPDVPAEAWGVPPEWPTTDGSGNMRPQIKHAHDLLRQAGWSFDAAQNLWTKGGQPLRFELLLSDPQNDKLALAYQSVLQKAGIELMIRIVDTAQYQKRVDTRAFDMMFHTFGTTLAPGAEQKRYWNSQLAKAQSSRNYAGIESKAIDRTCDLLTEASDPETVVTIMRVLDRLLRCGFYMRPLYNKSRELVAYWKGLHHPPSTGQALMPLESWWYEGEESTPPHPHEPPASKSAPLLTAQPPAAVG